MEVVGDVLTVTSSLHRVIALAHTHKSVTDRVKEHLCILMIDVSHSRRAFVFRRIPFMQEITIHSASLQTKIESSHSAVQIFSKKWMSEWRKTFEQNLKNVINYKSVNTDIKIIWNMTFESEKNSKWCKREQWRLYDNKISIRLLFHLPFSDFKDLTTASNKHDRILLQ